MRRLILWKWHCPVGGLSLWPHPAFLVFLHLTLMSARVLRLWPGKLLLSLAFCVSRAGAGSKQVCLFCGISRKSDIILSHSLTFSQKCPHHPVWGNSVIGISHYCSSHLLVFPLKLNSLGSSDTKHHRYRLLVSSLFPQIDF